MTETNKTCRVEFEVETSKNPHQTRTCAVEVHAGATLVQAAYLAGVTIQQTCGGTPSCTDCKVLIKSNLKDGLVAPEGPEIRLMGNVFHITKERLACQAIICGDISVYVPLYERSKKPQVPQKRR